MCGGAWPAPWQSHRGISLSHSPEKAWPQGRGDTLGCTWGLECQGSGRPAVWDAQGMSHTRRRAGEDGAGTHISTAGRWKATGPLGRIHGPPAPPWLSQAFGQPARSPVAGREREKLPGAAQHPAGATRCRARPRRESAAPHTHPAPVEVTARGGGGSARLRGCGRLRRCRDVCVRGRGFQRSLKSAWAASGEKRSESRGLCQGLNEKVPTGRGGVTKNQNTALHFPVTRLWQPLGGGGRGSCRCCSLRSPP